jgi:XTP/dITP diphosphohydrolase
VPAPGSPAENPPRDSRTSPPIRLLLASSNPGKLREYRMLVETSARDLSRTDNNSHSEPLQPAEALRIELDLLANFDRVPPFHESFLTFAENAAGKALHYSRAAQPEAIVLADDSGLVVPALAGAPGVHSARYAGPGASDEDRYRKLLHEMQSLEGVARRAHFVCVIAIARAGRALAVVSALARGLITRQPRGSQGFGYDPVFFFEELGRTYAETTREEKNLYSHRGKAFRKLLGFLHDPSCVAC